MEGPILDFRDYGRKCIQEFKNLENQDALTFNDQTSELHNFPGRRCQVPFVFYEKLDVLAGCVLLPATVANKGLIRDPLLKI